MKMYHSYYKVDRDKGYLAGHMVLIDVAPLSGAWVET